MGVVRHASAASTSRLADVDIYPYSRRQGTGRQLQPKQTSSSSGHYQTFNEALSPDTSLTSPVLFSSNPRSPGAFSWISADSSESGTSYELARRRGLSAAFYTPTSSAQASPSALPDTSPRSHQVWADNQRYTSQYLQDYTSDPSLTPPAALRGLGLPLKEAQPPLNGSRSYPSHNVEVINYQTVSSPPQRTRPGVRWRPLSPDARENAGAVRDSGGSCIRCTIMRERCDTEVPCHRCVMVSEKARSWKLPCSRKWLNDRGIYILPENLTSHLKIEQVNEFISNSSFFPLENSRIDVPLWIGFGDPFVIAAEEVDPIGSGLTLMQAFTPGIPVNVLSPPLRPRGHLDHHAVYSQIKLWMSQASQWPETLFPHPYHPAWERQSMGLICQQYQSMSSPKDENCIFTTSLRLSFALYVMSHSLTVPKRHVSRLFSQLHHPDFKDATIPEGSQVIPRAINKCIKAILLQLVRRLVASTCDHIHAQLGPKPDKNASFEAAFTASFLLLTATAQTQTSLFERALAGARNNDPSFSLADARRDIHTIETEFTQYVVHLFLLRYRPKKGKATATRSPPGAASPASAFVGSSSPPASPSFAESLQAVLRRDKDGIRAANRELGSGDDFDEELFTGSGVRNITRVLARLCAPLIED